MCWKPIAQFCELCKSLNSLNAVVAIASTDSMSIEPLSASVRVLYGSPAMPVQAKERQRQAWNRLIQSGADVPFH
jgi:hypothetical protein